MTGRLNRREFLSKGAAAGLMASGLSGPLSVLASEGDRPNILFVLTDDQRWDALSCMGHPFVKTPHMDRLAASGVDFGNAFVTTSICAASRASLFTGLVERTHRYTFGTPPLRATFTDCSYPTLLRRAGYRTGFVGKFGVGVERGAPAGQAAGRQQERAGPGTGSRVQHGIPLVSHRIARV